MGGLLGEGQRGSTRTSRLTPESDHALATGFRARCRSVASENDGVGTGTTETPAGWKAWRGGDVVLATALLCLGVWVRWDLVGVVETSSDATDPIRNALLIIEGKRSAWESSFPFGFGRDLGFAALIQAPGDGLRGLAVARLLAQSLLAPGLYLSCVALVVGRPPPTTRLGFAVAGALTALSPGLLRTFVSGHESYLAAEWIGLALLLCAAGAGRSLWLAAAGACAAVAAMNHPMAAGALVPLVPLVASGRGRARQLGAFFAGFAVFLLPVAASALPAIAGGLIGEYRGSAPFGRNGLLQTAALVFAGPNGFEPRAISALAFLTCTLAAASSRSRILMISAGGLAGIVLALALGLLTQHASPWHWRPLLPLLLLAPALLMADRSAPVWARVLPAVGTAGLLVAVLGHPHARPGAIPEQVGQIGVIEHVATTLGTSGSPVALAGYYAGPAPWSANLQGVALELRLRGLAHRWETRREFMLGARTLVFAEGDAEEVARWGAATEPEGVSHFSRSRRFLLKWAEDAAAARRWGSTLCRSSDTPTVAIHTYDALALLAPKTEWKTDVVPGLDACVLRDSWVRIEPPADEDVFRTTIRDLGAEDVEFQLNAIEIARFEATESQWSSCAAGGACPAREPAPPYQAVSGVTAEEAESFCRWQRGRLPTFVEWHRAAQAGGEGAWSAYPWGDEAPAGRARFGQPSEPREVGAYARGSSRLGVEDLVGNVAEWVRANGGRWSCGQPEFRPDDAPRYVLVGGGAEDDPRVLGRGLCKHVVTKDSLGGVRCVREPPG